MGDNTLTTISEPATIEVADVNKFFTALVGDFLPRNASTGAIEDNVHKLGRLATRWKEAHITDLFLGGSLFDPDAVGVDTKFAINAGATRTDSEQPDFLRADGTGASAKILGATTTFQITANNTSVSITSDLAITSLTTAPAANNTALVDDTNLAGGNSTKFTGEDVGDLLTIDTVGSEITDRIGEFICLKTPTGEFMFAFVEDATTLNRCYRGFFFDDSGDPVVRDVLSNNDTLTLMSLGWVFLDNNGTTIDVSYTSPIYSGVEPSGPVADDYWFDLKNRLWKRFDGSVFQQVDRMLIGILVIDGTNCVAARSFDFTKSYSDIIDVDIELESNTQVKTQKGYSSVDVYGTFQELYAGAFVWDITSDLETGVSEAADTRYYLYVTEEGIPTISDERPFNRISELRGYYHPYHSWRCIGAVHNDGSSNFLSVRFGNLLGKSAWDITKIDISVEQGDLITILDDIHIAGYVEIEIYCPDFNNSNNITDIVFELGDSGGFETSGYLGYFTEKDVSSIMGSSQTSNIMLFDSHDNSDGSAWTLKLRRPDSKSNTWYYECRGMEDFTNTPQKLTECIGWKTTSGETESLRIRRITTAGQFNGGIMTIKARYEKNQP